VDLNIPMIGMLKRKAEKVIINTALGELKKQVEG
ncbi:MAG: cyclase, partial [Tomitella sp.]|nr:cyclase [Tomitella sp.]